MFLSHHLESFLPQGNVELSRGRASEGQEAILTDRVVQHEVDNVRGLIFHIACRRAPEQSLPSLWRAGRRRTISRTHKPIPLFSLIPDGGKMVVEEPLGWMERPAQRGPKVRKLPGWPVSFGVHVDDQCYAQPLGPT
eukprot:45730-Hanusia_phi.AAC.1